MKRRTIYAAIGLSILGAALWIYRRAADKKVDTQIAAPVLKADEVRKIVIDSKRHQFITVERQPNGSEKVTRSFLNTHGPVAIVDKKDGHAVLVQRVYGTCASPFIGVALGSDIHAHAALGLNLLYVQRFELGGGLLLGSDIHDTRVFVGGTYNVYSNILVGVGIDNRKTAQLLAALKF